MPNPEPAAIEPASQAAPEPVPRLSESGSDGALHPIAIVGPSELAHRRATHFLCPRATFFPGAGFPASAVLRGPLTPCAPDILGFLRMAVLLRGSWFALVGDGHVIDKPGCWSPGSHPDIVGQGHEGLSSSWGALVWSPMRSSTPTGPQRQAMRRLRCCRRTAQSRRLPLVRNLEAAFRGCRGIRRARCVSVARAELRRTHA
jgi:hypothetical protein